MKTLSATARATALAAALFAAALPATAAMKPASITLAAPMAGATLDAGRVDMSVYYTATTGEAFEVVATYVSDTAPEKPLQLSMALTDGDNVHFGLPGHPETLFSFARHGNAVTVSSQPAAVPASTGA